MLSKGAGPGHAFGVAQECEPGRLEKGKAVQTKLSLWRRQLGDVPESVWQHTELRILILADNGLTALSPKIGQLACLTTLDLGHNALTSLPDALGDLVELRDFLYLHGNCLSRLLETLGNLTRLRYLNVAENLLTTLSETVGRMTELIELRAQCKPAEGASSLYWPSQEAA
ncbi:leucine-rich repeat domain-containing protein [Streptomyces antimycoticus]